MSVRCQRVHTTSAPQPTSLPLPPLPLPLPSLALLFLPEVKRSTSPFLTVSHTHIHTYRDSLSPLQSFFFSSPFSRLLNLIARGVHDRLCCPASLLSLSPSLTVFLNGKSVSLSYAIRSFLFPLLSSPSPPLPFPLASANGTPSA